MGAICDKLWRPYRHSRLAGSRNSSEKALNASCERFEVIMYVCSEAIERWMFKPQEGGGVSMVLDWTVDLGTVVQHGGKHRIDID